MQDIEVIGEDEPTDPGTVDTVPWESFLKTFIKVWEPGEHVAVIGPTGQGKSVLISKLVKERAKRRNAEVVVFGTKPKDSTLDNLGFPILRSWEEREYGQKQVVLWPAYGDPETAAERQHKAFRPVLRHLFMEGNRTIVFDEIRDFEHRLGFRKIVEEYWFMSRSNNITIVAGTQRPRSVSRSMFSEPSWLFLFPIYDVDDLNRIGEIGGDTQTMKGIVSSLPDHAFLCVRRRTRELVVSRVEL